MALTSIKAEILHMIRVVEIGAIRLQHKYTEDELSDAEDQLKDEGYVQWDTEEGIDRLTDKAIKELKEYRKQKKK